MGENNARALSMKYFLNYFLMIKIRPKGPGNKVPHLFIAKV